MTPRVTYYNLFVFNVFKIFFLKIIIFILNYFDELILKINLKNKKYYFNIFLNKHLPFKNQTRQVWQLATIN